MEAVGTEDKGSVMSLEGCTRMGVREGVGTRGGVRWEGMGMGMEGGGRGRRWRLRRGWGVGVEEEGGCEGGRETRLVWFAPCFLFFGFACLLFFLPFFFIIFSSVYLL